jgi:pheromone shutdown protein TraB
MRRSRRQIVEDQLVILPKPLKPPHDNSDMDETPLIETPVTPARAKVILLGTSHIAKQSVTAIKRSYAAHNPDVIAVELDPQRLDALLHPAPDKGIPLSMIKRIGVSGYLFLILGKWLQRKLGNIVKMDPGADMLAAVTLARENKKQLALIDQDIQVTLRHLSKQFGWREKLRVVRDIITAPFQKQKVTIDLNKVPDERMLELLIGQLRERYPSLYHVLIIERNIVMATRIDRLARTNPGKTILVVIGAGHMRDLRERLRPLEKIADIQQL